MFSGGQSAPTERPGSPPHGRPERYASENDSGPTGTGRPATRADANRYARLKRAVWAVDIAVSLIVPAGLLFSDGSVALRDLAFRINGHAAVALLAYVLVLLGGLQILTLPLDFYGGRVLERRFGLSRQTAREWLGDWSKGAALQFVLGLAAIELIYSLMRALPGTWWLAAAASFIAIFVLLANLAPVVILPLFFKFEPLTDEDLRGRLLRLSERVGAKVRGVYVWKLGEKTAKSNAALAGWGNTRRIIIADTLIEGSAPEEIEAVLAHEMGHHASGDIGRAILLQSALTLAGFWLLSAILSAWSAPLGFEGVSDFANLPLLFLAAAAASLAALPAANAYSRWRERAADEFALRVTGRPEAFASAMEKLAGQNLLQTDPHPVIEFLFHSHPSMSKRIARARSLAAQQARAESRLRDGEAGQAARGDGPGC